MNPNMHMQRVSVTENLKSLIDNQWQLREKDWIDTPLLTIDNDYNRFVLITRKIDEEILFTFQYLEKMRHNGETYCKTQFLAVLDTNDLARYTKEEICIQELLETYVRLMTHYMED